MFQSTHPHGVRPPCSASKAKVFGFNPRTHTGCDGFVQGNGKFDFVSIHAPTRGATSFGTREASSSVSFNPRTHTGCDRICASSLATISGFNPRTHTGCDLGYGPRYYDYKTFQSTHPHGVRQTGFSIIRHTREFQSTHPHGVRHVRTILFASRAKFQSTHPHGVRPDPARRTQTPKAVSIHAPTRGATSGNKFYHSGLCFNPRTHTGCDGIYQGKRRMGRVSIHAPTRGATLLAARSG